MGSKGVTAPLNSSHLQLGEIQDFSSPQLWVQYWDNCFLVHYQHHSTHSSVTSLLIVAVNYDADEEDWLKLWTVEDVGVNADNPDKKFLDKKFLDRYSKMHIAGQDDRSSIAMSPSRNNHPPLPDKYCIYCTLEELVHWYTASSSHQGCCRHLSTFWKTKLTRVPMSQWNWMKIVLPTTHCTYLTTQWRKIQLRHQFESCMPVVVVHLPISQASKTVSWPAHHFSITWYQSFSAFIPTSMVSPLTSRKPLFTTPYTRRSVTLQDSFGSPMLPIPTATSTWGREHQITKYWWQQRSRTEQQMEYNGAWLLIEYSLPWKDCILRGLQRWWSQWYSKIHSSFLTYAVLSVQYQFMLNCSCSNCGNDTLHGRPDNHTCWHLQVCWHLH